MAVPAAQRTADDKGLIAEADTRRRDVTNEHKARVDKYAKRTPESLARIAAASTVRMPAFPQNRPQYRPGHMAG